MSACETCIHESRIRALTVSKKVSEKVGGYQQDLSALEDELKNVRRFSLGEQLATLATELTFAETTGQITAYCRHDAAFPGNLAATHPEIPVIYVAGQQEHFPRLSETTLVAIAGARRATAYGRDVAYYFGNDLPAESTVLTSLSLGIAGAAHRGALQQTKPSIAFLAGDPTKPYPTCHHILFDQIKRLGCAISVIPPGLEVSASAFPFRMQLMGALTDALIYVEGVQLSSAEVALNAALRHGRAVGAVPGPITSPLSAGPNSAIADSRAALVTQPSEIPTN